MKDYDGGMVTSVNQSDFVKTALRLPPDVHVRLHEAAQANGRSYNAEIIARLQESFSDNPEVTRLRSQLEEEQMRSLKMEYEVLKMQNSAMSKDDVLYILLDTNGQPIAWEEIYAYLDEIRRLGGKLPSRWETSIITPEIANDTQRAKQVMLLTKKLRGMGISQAISRLTRQQVQGDSNKLDVAGALSNLATSDKRRIVLKSGAGKNTVADIDEKMSKGESERSQIILVGNLGREPDLPAKPPGKPKGPVKSQNVKKRVT